MEQVITVGLGELVVSDNPGAVLVAFGLGSCVGICAYDPVRRVGGLLHAMLPLRHANDSNRTKYVDTGIAELLRRMLATGARRDQLTWRFAGGAQMLTAPGISDRFNIGQQNVNMTHEIISSERLRLLGSETGGHAGRTVRLYVASGRVSVRTVNGEEHGL